MTVYLIPKKTTQFLTISITNLQILFNFHKKYL